MQNPILQAININNQLQKTKEMLRNGNPEQIMQQMMNTNPQFKKFVEDNRNKTPQQIASEYGVDISQIYR